MVRAARPPTCAHAVRCFIYGPKVGEENKSGRRPSHVRDYSKLEGGQGHGGWERWDPAKPACCAPRADRGVAVCARCRCGTFLAYFTQAFTRKSTQVVNAQPTPSPPTTFLGMLAPNTPLAW